MVGKVESVWAIISRFDPSMGEKQNAIESMGFP